MKTAIGIISGGMDSSVLAYVLAEEEYQIHFLSFDYGQRHRVELDHAKKIVANLNAPWKTIFHRHTIIDIAAIGKGLASSLTNPSIPVPDGHYQESTMKATVVPNRNAIMLAIAYGYAVAEHAEMVATGVHSGDHFIYPDCRPEFIHTIEAAFMAGNAGFGTAQIYTPFLNRTKADIVSLGAAFNVPFQDTWSCYKGGEIHCGTCGTCYERREAFMLAEVPDPTIYADNTPLEEIRKANHVQD